MSTTHIFLLMVSLILAAGVPADASPTDQELDQLPCVVIRLNPPDIYIRDPCRESLPAAAADAIAGPECTSIPLAGGLTVVAQKCDGTLMLP